MKPVLIQTLMRNMRNRIHLPAPTAESSPIKKDRSGQFVLAFAVLVIVALIFM